MRYINYSCYELLAVTTLFTSFLIHFNSIFISRITFLSGAVNWVNMNS